MGLGLVLAIWRFFVVGWFGWLVGVESGIKVVFVGLLCFCLCLALLLVLLGESLVQGGKRGGESASSKIVVVLAPLECLTIYTLHPAGER